MDIAVVVASRANWGRVKSVCRAIDDHPKLNLRIILAASAMGLEIDYEPDAIIQCLLDGDNLQGMTLTTGLFLAQVGGVLERLKPDIVYLHGDRYELLAPAIAASYQCIPIAHAEGGELSGTIDGKVRHSITKLADIHFPVTEGARQRIVSMGEDPGRVHVVGSTALDILVDIDFANPRREPYVVIVHHPNTTDPEDLMPLVDAINQLDIHKVWVNPNVDAGSKAMLKIIHRQDVEFAKNLSPEDYARLIYNSSCLLGNTSSGIKEGAFLGVPYVCIGNRQKGREHGRNVIFVENRTDEIVKAAKCQMEHGRYPRDYRFGDGKAAKRIVEVLSCL